MIDTGKAFCAANNQFMNGIRDLAQYSSKDVLVEVSTWERDMFWRENKENVLLEWEQV